MATKAPPPREFLPILDLKLPARQNGFLAASRAVIQSRCPPGDFKQLERIAAQVADTNIELAAHDAHSSDDEAATEQKSSASGKAAQAARGSELIRLGNEKASLVKRSHKASEEILVPLSKAEIEHLKTVYACAYNQAIADNDPRQLLALIKEHWRITMVEQSWLGRLSTVFADAVVNSEDSQIQILERCKISFNTVDGDPEQ